MDNAIHENVLAYISGKVIPGHLELEIRHQNSLSGENQKSVRGAK